MSNRLPDRVDPWQLCARGQVLEGRVPLGALRRLVPLLASSEGEAAFTLAFSKDAERRPVVQVDVTAGLDLVCQRCLGKLRLDVREMFSLGLVEGLEQAERLPEELEPQLVDETGLDPREVVEDALILAVPVTPRHAPGECTTPGASSSADGPAEEQKRENPFAVLSTLKKGDRSKDS